ncbi:uncharacterized protein PFL1_02767 [Pseudozyma flocculosa PF-1]|uniref:WD40 repeat-like protein n=2 Tax=Pseudozyma flocculosa TaxID=84751 RepID=A0A5C3F1C2_9BASI|nr:uncharacterized protein PFL1_02767 [Pseudozyma flocculosa PF-1]EPQ29548.1 hypothetical protein PFL1_02767 [Pseudozyma flocculosa PF-1]SPO38092.1 uncharacterized protein PSFLO_03569 [Pseudozyma flocculosa]
MACATYQSLSPNSAFRAPIASSSRLDPPRARGTHATSSLFQRQTQLDDNFVQRLDRIDVLGGWTAHRDLVGHTGCVNALSWSQSGQLLASGSDDRNVVLWQLGSAEQHPVAEPDDDTNAHDHGDGRDGGDGGAASDEVVAQWPQRSHPSLDVGMMGKIQTGHRANIFSVKWAPHSSDRRLFTCAGDRTVRVFDINHSGIGPGSGQTQRTADGKEYTLWNQGSGACIRLFRCHKDRAKRISTENSPDVFLTCGEDGDIRQMDLRTPHACGPRRGYGEGCPSPLVHFPFGLYSLSVSKTEPWLFAVAGMSPYAYLQDRRMVPRLLKREWGIEADPSSPDAADAQALTMCVRRFGLPPGGFFAPHVEDDGKTIRAGRRSGGDEDGDESEDEAGESSDDDEEPLGGLEDAHITACKINESTGRDLVLSYSNHFIYRFQIHDEPGVLHHEPKRRRLPGGRTHRNPETILGEEIPARDSAWLEGMQRRCLQALFPLTATAEVRQTPGRVAAFWNDIKDLTEELGPIRDEDDMPLDAYAAVEVCRALGVVAFSEDKPGWSQLLHHCLDEIHDQFGDFAIGTQVAPWLERLIDAIDQGATATRTDEIKNELWARAEPLVSETWTVERLGPSQGRCGVDGGAAAASEGRRLKRARVAEEASDPRNPQEGSQLHGQRLSVAEGSDDEELDSDDASSATASEAAHARFRTASSDAGDDEGEDDHDDEEEAEDESSSNDTDSEGDAVSSGEEMELSEPEGYGFETDMSAGIEDKFQRAPLVCPRNHYRGHANIETVKDVNFAGRDDRYVVSGSDDGNWFLWDTETAELRGIWRGDSSVVNVLQQHPSLPVMAISGIDDTVKLFGPVTLSSGPPAQRAGSGEAPGKVADRMAKKDDIMSQNRERLQGSRQRSSLSTRTLLSMLQQHVLQGNGSEGGPEARRRGARMVLRPLVGGGWAVTTAEDANEEAERGLVEEGEEGEAEDCVVM